MGMMLHFAELNFMPQFRPQHSKASRSRCNCTCSWVLWIDLKMRKSNGPSTVPWGTPDSNGPSLEWSPNSEEVLHPQVDNVVENVVCKQVAILSCPNVLIVQCFQWDFWLCPHHSRLHLQSPQCKSPKAMSNVLSPYGDSQWGRGK